MDSNFYLTFPITTAMHDRATQFSQPVYQYPEKYNRIYRNTIAVSLMQYYLSDFLGLETEIESGLNWNLANRLVLDVADLVIPKVGTLECRTVQPEDTSCSIPAEVWTDRMGYVVIEINPEQTAGKLLGFTPKLDADRPDFISLLSLQSIETLLDAIEMKLSNPIDILQDTVQMSVTKLSNWLKGEISGAWQEISNGFQTLGVPEPEVGFSFRHGTSSETSQTRPSVKGQQQLLLKDLPLALILEYIPEPEANKILLDIKVCSTDDRVSIPPNLQLIVRAGDTVLNVAQREIGNYVEKRLRGVSGEQFQVQVVWQDAVFVETFEI